MSSFSRRDGVFRRPELIMPPLPGRGYPVDDDVAARLFSVLSSSGCDDILSKPEAKIVDPCDSNGTVLKSLVENMVSRYVKEGVFGSEQEARDHILHYQVFSVAQNEVDACMIATTLYGNRDARHATRCAPFDSERGNIVVLPKHRRHKPKTKKGDGEAACIYCNLKKDQYKGKSSYSAGSGKFCHLVDLSSERLQELMLKETGVEFFDLAVSNPPYNGAPSENNMHTDALYPGIVNRTFPLARVVLEIIPSRWMYSGKGDTKKLRENILGSGRTRAITDYPDGKEVFPTVNIEGGCMFLLWDKNYSGSCKYTYVRGGVESSRTIDTAKYYKDERFEAIVRDPLLSTIVDKVMSKVFLDENGNGTLKDVVRAQEYFHIEEGCELSATSDGMIDPVMAYFSGGKKGFVERSKVSNAHNLDLYKVCFSRNMPAFSVDPLKPKIILPGEFCNGSFPVVEFFNNRFQAENCKRYLETNFVRGLIFAAKTTTNTTGSTFRFVPKLPWNESWTDEKLFDFFDLNEEEREYIRAQGWLKK